MIGQQFIRNGFPIPASTLYLQKVLLKVLGYRFLNRSYRRKVGNGFRDILIDAYVQEQPPEHPFF